METGCQLLPDSLRLAAFDTGCRFQATLGVKREWKQRKDGGKDYPGHPEMAHMHETDDATSGRKQLRGIHLLCRRRLTSDGKIEADE
jgi:hypothetical protein